jgi:hypothetical protein
MSEPAKKSLKFAVEHHSTANLSLDWHPDFSKGK